MRRKCGRASVVLGPTVVVGASVLLARLFGPVLITVGQLALFSDDSRGSHRLHGFYT